MNDSQPQSTKWRWSKTSVLVALMMLGLSIGFYMRTFTRSEDITIFDVSFFADEGLVTLKFPLTRLSKVGTCKSGIRVFDRSKTSWTSGTTYPGTTIRRPMRKSIEDRMATAQSSSDPFGGANSGIIPATKSRRDFFVLADFGFMYGDRLSDDRPGPCVKVFAPVWFVGLSCYLLYLLFTFKRLRFGIRTLVVLMVIVAVFTWATHLRIPS